MKKKMRRISTCVTFLSVLSLCIADKITQLDGEGTIFGILLKRIEELEENVRKSDRKLEEIPILKMRLDDAERQLSHFQDLQYRLEKSEEKIYELVNQVERKKCDESQETASSSTVLLSELNATKEDKTVGIVSRNAFTTMFSQAKKSGNVEKLASFKNQIQGEIMKEEKTERRSIPSKVAFTALFSSAQIQLMAGRALLFDRVDYNEGNAYDKTSGMMTCPITGTYFFYTDVLSQPNALDVATEIVHEGNGKGRTYAYGGSHNVQGGISAILHCRTGERVWVRTNYGFQIYGADHSSFSGFILWVDADASSSN